MPSQPSFRRISTASCSLGTEFPQSAMDIRSVYVLLLVYLFLLSYSPSPLCNPVPKPLFNISKTIGAIGNIPRRLWNNTKSFIKWGETTTVTPKITTKASLSIVIVPKKWAARKQNTTNITTFINYSGRNKTDPVQVKPTVGWGGWWRKNILGISESTTPKPSRYVLLVPVNYDKFTGRQPSSSSRSVVPCETHKNSSRENCKTIEEIPSPSLPWWMILLALSGVTTTVGLLAWTFAMRRCKEENFASPWNFLSPQSQPPPLRPGRSPAPLPAFVSAQPSPGDPTSPTRATLLFNPIYHTTAAAAASTTPVHVYATPTLRRGQPLAVWTSGVADHVHIYEPPPRYPSIDSGDSEIDTTVIDNNEIIQESKCSQRTS